MMYWIVGMIFVLAILVIGGMWALYNTLVRLRAYVDEGASGIDVQLKRRYDLIPNLVAVVKQYGIHEQNVLERVTQLRASAMQARTLEQKAVQAGELESTLKTLFALSEQYPDLKANHNFIELQKQLVAIEHEIQLSRRYYNGAARAYNTAIDTFPANMVAKWGGFTRIAYFQALDTERDNVRVTF
jgi:LemA protein